MKEFNQEEIDFVLKRIHNDVLDLKKSDMLISLKYNFNVFPQKYRAVLTDVLPFFPNLKYKGKVFIMSVILDKSNNSVEIIVKNPIM